MLKFRLILVAGLVSLALTGSAFAITLPDPNEILFGQVPVALQYGDFYSYSLPILDYYDQTYGANTGQYYVQSSPGQIADDIVIATQGSEHNIAGVENAYDTPNSDSIPTFSTRTSANPGQVGPAFTGQQTGTWDAQLSALQGALGTSNDLVFFFNNNQTSSGSAADQNLYAWGQIELIDLQDSSRTLYFDFTNTRTSNDVTLYNSPGLANVNTNYPIYDLTPDPIPDTIPTPPGTWPYEAKIIHFEDPPGSGIYKDVYIGDFVLSGGQVELGSDGKIYFPSLGLTRPAGVTLVKTFNHNLGANQAAYAVFSPELNDIFKAPNFNGYDLIRGDFRMGTPQTKNIDWNGNLNNGYEQLFIRGSTVEEETLPRIPEPATLILFGAGLAALGVRSLKRKK